MPGLREAALALVAALVLAGGVVGAVQHRSRPPAVRTEQAWVYTDPGVRLDTTLYLPAAGRPAPAVVLSPGFGQDKAAVAGEAVELARHGYVVLAWSLRGFGRSSGAVSLGAPEAEVHDLSVLITGLAGRPEVLRDGPGDPRVALVGASYGGGVSLLTAAYDHRVDAVVPIITWSSLLTAFLPDAAGGEGVFKAQYAALFFGAGGAGAAGTCGRFTAALCLAYTKVARTGLAGPPERALLRRSSPAGVLGRVSAPTLLLQGEDDTLFPLSESLATATALRSHGVPVSVGWVAGGHDRPFSAVEEGRLRGLTRSWLDRWLRQDPRVATGPVFRWDRADGSPGSAATLPPLVEPAAVALQGPATQQLANPPGGRPASVSSLPGSGALAGFSAAAATLDPPGQTAGWQTRPLAQARELLGAGRLTLRVRSSTRAAVLFAKVYDVAPDGTARLPGGLVAPFRLTALPPSGREVTVTLPALAHVFPAGHRIRVGLSATDLGYAGPSDPAGYTVVLDPSAALRLPLTAVPGGSGYRSLAVTAGLLGLLALLPGAYLVARRRPDPDRADLGRPVEVRALTKSYPGGLRAVDGVDLTVERGQVVGLLGPNGAGKTTTLRMLAGLITPTSGEVRLFGRPVAPGAPVLSRVGLFVEGPGLLPHLSGRDNLRLYWTSAARSMEGSHVEEALELAGLGAAVDRPVRTYSHGMKQRLAIAQALLGRPDLLILDEPTNGLDPPQIREIRELLQRIAGTGRTVLVSSHLLSEVEQMCTHAVVMAKGRVAAAGPVADLLAGDSAVQVDVATADLLRAAQAARRLPGVRSASVTGSALLVDLDGTPRSELVRGLVAAGVGVEGVATRRRLEDVFLELLGADR